MGLRATLPSSALFKRWRLCESVRLGRPPLHPRPRAVRANLRGRSTTTLLAAALILLAVAFPGVRMDAHAAAHWLSPVDPSQHHHHDASGAVVVHADHHDHGHDHHHPNEGAPQQDGHEHMPTPGLGIEAPLTAQPAALVAPAPNSRLRAGQDREPPDLPPRPQRRPPRFV